MSQSEQLHLNDDLLTDHMFSGVPLSGVDAAHLERCAACRARLLRTTMLAQELAVAQRSQPSPAAVARYTGFFEQVQRRPSWLAGAVDWLLAQLTFDTRSALAGQGVRSVATAGYRLLYASPTLELDLLVEPSGASRHVEGEVAPLGASVQMLPALVQLVDSSGATVTELETTADGRFRLTAAPGLYQVWLTPRNGAMVQIEGLHIS